ncbi:nuclear transport factor 2 family protein [Streptomyces sp. V3I7]|uniref:nuclear transport factor 2 family protein n=1 Tax=Streptomyces sp. V3I7 TaxID=3042278 RepID=UPI0027D8AAA3|nr:nuclear transport factor 2 family protein [Streptomyces sp. V3I7]
MTQEPDDVRQAIEGELRLHDPAVRSSPSEILRLLDPEFVEVGSSGRRYTYAEMIAELPSHPGSQADGPRYEPSEITGVLLAPGLVQLTYETDFDGLRARRTSLWRKRDEETGWRMYYHQGTPVPPAADQWPCSRG